MPTYDFNQIDADSGSFELRQIAIGLTPGLILFEVSLNDSGDDFEVTVTSDANFDTLQGIFQEAAETLKANGYGFNEEEN